MISIIMSCVTGLILGLILRRVTAQIMLEYRALIGWSYRASQVLIGWSEAAYGNKQIQSPEPEFKLRSLVSTNWALV